MRAVNVGKRYLRRRAESNVFYPVKNADLELKSGEVAMLYGASGSGKTTLLSILAGLLVPEEGQVLVDGDELYRKNDRELSEFRGKHIGVIPQGTSAISSLTVKENVLLPYLLGKKTESRNRAEMEARAEELLLMVGMRELADTMPRELSGGELRRMAIARALVRDPEVILADEPTSDLDAENTKHVLALFRKVAQDGKKVLIVTHDSETAEYADAIYRMDAGKIERGEKK